MEMNIEKEYALYKGEELIQIGTIKELAESQNVTEHTIKFYSYPCYLKRIKNSRKRKVVVPLD